MTDNKTQKCESVEIFSLRTKFKHGVPVPNDSVNTRKNNSGTNIDLKHKSTKEE